MKKYTIDKRNYTEKSVLENHNMIETQTHVLEKGKTRNIGWFESIPLRIAGRRDGRNGLPREDQTGNWYSAILSREVHSYKEFCDRVWGKLQIDIAEHFARLGYLLDNLKQLESDLDEYRNQLNVMEKMDPEDKLSRRKGEEMLSESQITARRTKEHLRKLQPIKNTIQSLEAEFTESLQEATLLKNAIKEANNGARIICERVMDHTRLRVDVYWNAAFARHPENSRMPVIPVIQLIPDAEIVYFSQHKTFLDEAEKTISYLTQKYDITTEKKEEMIHE